MPLLAKEPKYEVRDTFGRFPALLLRDSSQIHLIKSESIKVGSAGGGLNKDVIFTSNFKAAHRIPRPLIVCCTSGSCGSRPSYTPPQDPYRGIFLGQRCQPAWERKGRLMTVTIRLPRSAEVDIGSSPPRHMMVPQCRHHKWLRTGSELRSAGPGHI
ncbi:hypothetical protein LZ30DRAFT_194424 [Colletotrichum cereale]|nr:hypothetical protein LZ30DRAFT_194424 [Colletotrichum cereale]